MFLKTFEKGIRKGICLSIKRSAKANYKYVKDHDKNKESSYLKYWMQIIYLAGQCRKSCQ